MLSRRSWLAFAFFKGDQFHVHSKLSKIYAAEPSQPINITWKNYSYSRKTKFLRRLFSWSVYVLAYSLRKFTPQFQSKFRKINFVVNFEFLALALLFLFSTMKGGIVEQRPPCKPRVGKQLMISKDWILGKNLSLTEIQCLCFSHPREMTAK